MPEAYRLVFTRSALGELNRLPNEDARRIMTRIQRLISEPRPPRCEKLRGADAYRIRQGDYRILYIINEADRLIEIYKIGHRREVYR